MEHVELILFGLPLVVPGAADLRRRPRVGGRGGAGAAGGGQGGDRAAAARVLAAERTALLDLRNTGAISDDVRRRVERGLDLEESRLGA